MRTDLEDSHSERSFLEGDVYLISRLMPKEWNRATNNDVRGIVLLSRKEYDLKSLTSSFHRCSLPYLFGFDEIRHGTVIIDTANIESRSSAFTAQSKQR